MFGLKNFCWTPNGSRAKYFGPLSVTDQTFFELTILWTQTLLDSNFLGPRIFLGPKSFLDPTFFSPYICFWLKIFSDTKLFLAYKFWRLKKCLDQKCFLDPDFWDKKVKVNQDPTQLKSRVWLSQLSLFYLIWPPDFEKGLQDYFWCVTSAQMTFVNATANFLQFLNNQKPKIAMASGKLA